MAAEILLDNAKTDTVGRDVSIRIIGSQIAPARMSVQIAISGGASVEIQGRVHKNAPWAAIGPLHEQSCLLYIDPIWSLRAVSSRMTPGASVSVWAAWSI
jgi:hypothetical protein